MIDKKLLLEISALKLEGKIEKFGDDQMHQYEQLLVSFIESFPVNEKKIKAALAAKDKDSLVTQLQELCVILEKIHANDLASEGREFIKVLKNSNYENERIEAFISVFFATLAMLSIDIHMAKYLEENAQTVYIQKKKEKAAAKSHGEKTILAVDDAAISLTLLKKSLQGAPFKLICVNSGESALKFLEDNDPDLFILDIEMPKMNGYELAGKIRENGHEAPIIFLTGNSTKEYVIKALRAGASDFIVKPIYKENLVEKISKHLYS
jgi:CheY-like chemotaxis protein